jgi:uncharacterized protein with PIN domain
MWKPKRCPNCGWVLEPNEADETEEGQREYYKRTYVHYNVYCNNCGWSMSMIVRMMTRNLRKKAKPI